MKKNFVPALLATTLLSSCTYNTPEGEQHVSIMFWFFIAGISISLILVLWLIFRKYKKKK